MAMVICKEIEDYLKYAETHPKWINKKRKLLIKNIVKPTLKRNDVFFDEKTYRDCLQYCKSNFYELFPFQKFIYAFAFMYKDDIPVFSKFFIKEGRGNGKDGFIVPLVNFFQTPLYGVKNYHVEIVANSESQAKDADLINQVVAEAERASHDAEFKKQLGLRNLSQEEKKFYEGFKDIKQSVTANQIDIIPTEIIDRTLDDVRKASPILKLVNMAPANVKKWIVASHSGAAVWGDLTDEIKGELSGTISALNIELHMLSAYLVIPKAIRELSMEFVDRYFMAILSEAMQDGLVKGYLDGDGKTGPIGIFRQIGTTNGDGTNKAKTVLNNITKFSPKGLANVRKTLTNNGKRVVTKLYLICNPADEAEYVDPCMFGEALTGGYVNKTFIDIEKIPDANCPQGKAAFTIDGYYTMGATGVRVTEYDQTKAMENADLIIANCFANGRAVDDNVAVIFDVTKLEEYVINVHQTSTASV